MREQERGREVRRRRKRWEIGDKAVRLARNGNVMADVDMLCRRVFCELGLGRPFLLFDEGKGRDEALKSKVVHGEGWSKNEGRGYHCFFTNTFRRKMPAS